MNDINLIENEYQDLEKPGPFYENIELLSPIFIKESNILENSGSSELSLGFNENMKDILGDKECSPAPAPLRNSFPSNEIFCNHNMECPEVVNKIKDINEENILGNENLYDFEKIVNSQNDEIIDSKPISFDLIRYNNLTESFIFNSDNKGAPINIFEEKNFQFNEINSFGIAKNTSEYIENKNILKKYHKNNWTNKDNKEEDKNNENSLINPHYNNEKGNKKYKKIYLNLKKIFVRKLKSDSIRKKIKARTHKKIKEIINCKLKRGGSKMYFESLPQPFITNIKIEYNKNFLKYTMRELFESYVGYKNKDRDKVNINIKVLKYIDSSKNLKNQNDIFIFLNSTYEVILQDYFRSNYFLEDIEKLKNEKESQEYISKYKFIGEHWIEFYKNNGEIY